jgi:hypothetical protein
MGDSENLTNHETPTKSKIRGTISYLEAAGIPHFKSRIFDHFGVGHRRGWAIISDGSEDRRHYTTDGKEHRGRHSLVSNWHVKEMDRLIKEEGFEARKLSWQELAFEVGLEGVSSRTIARAMGGSMSYHKCIACQKKWCNPSTAKARKDYAEAKLQRYPEPEDWYIVRFSDEVHWAIGPQGSIYITRKPGERYCSDCIQQRNERDDREKKEVKKVHAWTAVGYNFKSPLTFYSIPGNTNGKMTQIGYIEQVLEPVVKPWIRSGVNFVLEEDGDSGHGPSKSNIVRKWKEDNHLKYYFNCHSSPDLAPIENCWQPPKQYVKKLPHWDEQNTRELAREGWDKISQDFINERVKSMPQRLRDCIEMDGQMTGW